MLRSRLVLANVIALAVLAGTIVTRSPAASADPRPFGDRSLLEDGPTTVATSSHLTLTDSLRTFDRTVRIGAADQGLSIDRTELTCHGGRAEVRWYVGNLEPTVPDTGIHLSARLDERVIGSILVGSTDGIWNDHPAQLLAIVDCPVGPRVLDLLIVSIEGAWGIPYVAQAGTTSDLRVGRGFVILEVWD